MSLLTGVNPPLDPPDPDVDTICPNCGTRYTYHYDGLDEGDICPDCQELEVTNDGDPFRVVRYEPLDYYDPDHGRDEV